MLTRRHLFTTFPESVDRREVQGVPTGQQRRAGHISSPNQAWPLRACNAMVTATTRPSPDRLPDDASDEAIFTGSYTRRRDALGWLAYLVMNRKKAERRVALF
jgi:hypothetical protein